MRVKDVGAVLLTDGKWYSVSNDSFTCISLNGQAIREIDWPIPELSGAYYFKFKSVDDGIEQVVIEAPISSLAAVSQTIPVQYP